MALNHFSAKLMNRFLLETASYVEMSRCLAVARSAFDLMTADDKEKHVRLNADLMNSQGLLLAHRGDFAGSEEVVLKAIRVRPQQNATDLIGISWAYCNIGNILASSGRFTEALLWAEKAIATRAEAQQAKDKKLSPEGVLMQNMGRILHRLNQYDTAQVHFKKAIEEFAHSENWAMLA